MDSKDILNAIDEFFRTADENALAEVNAALSVKIKGDVSLEEYLSGFNHAYFYANTPSSNTYVYSDKRLKPSGGYYEQMWFEDSEGNYVESDLGMSVKTEPENKHGVGRMIKKAA